MIIFVFGFATEVQATQLTFPIRYALRIFLVCVLYLSYMSLNVIIFSPSVLHLSKALRLLVFLNSSFKLCFLLICFVFCVGSLFFILAFHCLGVYHTGCYFITFGDFVLSGLLFFKTFWGFAQVFQQAWTF